MNFFKRILNADITVTESPEGHREPTRGDRPHRGAIWRVVHRDSRQGPLCDVCKDPSDAVRSGLPEYLLTSNGTKVGPDCANLIVSAMQKGGCDMCRSPFTEGAVLYDSNRLAICISCATKIADVMRTKEPTRVD